MNLAHKRVGTETDKEEENCKTQSRNFFCCSSSSSSPSSMRDDWDRAKQTTKKKQGKLKAMIVSFTITTECNAGPLNSTYHTHSMKSWKSIANRNRPNTHSLTLTLSHEMSLLEMESGEKIFIFFTYLITKMISVDNYSMRFSLSFSVYCLIASYFVHWHQFTDQNYVVHFFVVPTRWLFTVRH